MKKYISSLVVFALSCAVFIPATKVYSQGRGKASALYAPDKIIVKLRQAAETIADSAYVSDMVLPLPKSGADSMISQEQGGIFTLQLGEGLSVEEAIRLAQSDPRVEYAEPDYYLFPSASPNDTHFSHIWGLSNGQTQGADISALQAWDITTGSDDVVAVIIDSGVDLSHPDLAPNAWVNSREVAGNGVDDDNNGFIDDISGWNFFNNTNKFFIKAEEDYHGTHVAGTIGAAGNNSMGVTGVAWNAKLMSLKFLGGEKGSGSTSNALKAINYAIKQRESGVNVRVINASWGGGSESQALREGIEAAGQAGILFVCAAGNEATDGEVEPHYPSAYSIAASNVVSVAALDEFDQMSEFSNYGHSVVSVGAPGTRILSTLPKSAQAPNGGYGYLNGTSMATPYVSGIAVLLWSHEPELTPAQVKHRIVSTAEPALALASKTISSGRANAYYALTNRIAPRRSPAVANVTFGKTAVTIDGFGFMDASSVIEVNGVAVSGISYDNSYAIANGTLTRLTLDLGKKGMKKKFPKGNTFAITVFNPSTGERSAQKVVAR